MADRVPDNLEAALRAADEALIKVEMVGGIPVWEGMPSPKHQRVVQQIGQSVRRIGGHEGDCGCFSLIDVTIRFPDGSFKRPDVAIFCRQPDDDLPSVEIMPEAVVEVLSRGYEAKDLEIGLPFYEALSIADIVIVDPRTFDVLHVQKGARRQFQAPVELDLLCGCRIHIPV